LYYKLCDKIYHLVNYSILRSKIRGEVEQNADKMELINKMTLMSQRKRLSQLLADSILSLISWQVDVTLPNARKFVLVGAPHTSGLDLFYTMLLKFSTGIELRWVGKDTLFAGPLGVIMRWLGGIPVNRRSRNNFVEQIVEQFRQHEHLIIAIAPEGSRGKTAYWKTGFYHIASGAQVPIALGFIDYPSRVVGIGLSLLPSGDIQADFSQIKTFYSGKKGRHPQKQGEIQLRVGSTPTPDTAQS
jgi:1-acyl-sn-glycerol-3-phosphate acyltransferase